MVGEEAVEADPHVLQLCKDISAFYEAVARRLPIKLVDFVFGGTAQLIGQLFIEKARYLKRINVQGVVKMSRNVFVLQQGLESVGVDAYESMHRARQYYNLLEYDAEVRNLEE